MRQREWGTWVTGINDGTPIGALARRKYVENVRLHGSDCGTLNFPIASKDPLSELFVPPHRV
jgi:hypothetical protein